MKSFAFVMSVLLLLSAASAENYTGDYLVDGWLRVTRTVQVQERASCGAAAATGACASTGALLPVDLGTGAGYDTTVNLSAGNDGALQRREVLLTESLTYVPEGAKLEFSPKPHSLDGREVTWELGDLAPGEKKSFSYSFNAASRPGDVADVPEVRVASAPINAVLSAPASATVGQAVAVFLRAESGTPIAGATIKVIGPGGSISYLTTNSRGSAAFKAEKEGIYSYSVGGYSMARLARTRASAEEVPAVSAAAVSTGGSLASSLFGLLPLLGGILAIAVVAMIAYNFLSSRKEEQYSPPQQPPGPSPTAPGAQAPVYSQNYSFGASSKAEASPSRVDEVARQLVESRRRQMSWGADAVPLEVAESRKRQLPGSSVQPPGGEETPADWTESASSDEEVDGKLVQLEHKARAEGELASQEEEIEKAIAELESIRQKLRARKEEMESLSEQAEGRGKEREEEEPEDEEPSEPPARRAPPRTPPPQKKLKLGTHGVRRK